MAVGAIAVVAVGAIAVVAVAILAFVVIAATLVVAVASLAVVVVAFAVGAFAVARLTIVPGCALAVVLSNMFVVRVVMVEHDGERLCCRRQLIAQCFAKGTLVVVVEFPVVPLLSLADAAFPGTAGDQILASYFSLLRA